VVEVVVLHLRVELQAQVDQVAVVQVQVDQAQQHLVPTARVLVVVVTTAEQHLVQVAMALCIFQSQPVHIQAHTQVPT
jgi:hypothetical protein